MLLIVEMQFAGLETQGKVTGLLTLCWAGDPVNALYLQDEVIGWLFYQV